MLENNQELMPSVQADRLFVETLSDLRGRVEAATPSDYQLLMSAGLVRKLLLDSQPLMDAVNRSHGLKVRFPTNIAEDPLFSVVAKDRITFWAIGDGLYPPTALAPRAADLKRDAFLARLAVISQGREATVRDVIKQVANVEGAVHPGSPRNALEAALSDTNATVHVGGYPSLLQTLRTIGRVTLAGLEPLEAAVRTSLVAPD